MNILPHKSWNVWNQKNRDKVLRDEMEHEEKQRQIEKRKSDIEQERRLHQMKDRKRKDLGGGERSDDDGEKDKRKPSGKEEEMRHVNFFEEAEAAEVLAKRGVVPGGGNAEYEKEKKEEEEKKRKSCGTMPWKLGEGSLESKKETAWYEEISRGRSSTDSNAAAASASPAAAKPSKADEKEAAEEKAKRKQEMKKQKDDPLALMNRYLSEKRAKTSSSSSADRAGDERGGLSKQQDAIDRLRRERLERERAERDRVAEIMGYKKPTQPQEERQNKAGYYGGFSQIHGGRTRQEYQEERQREREKQQQLRGGRYFDVQK